MCELDTEIAERLENNCKSYLKHTIEHLILQKDDYDNLLQIVINIQGALESVIKLFIVKNKGYQEISILKKHQKGYTEKQLLNDLHNGLLKFCNYEDLLEKVNLSLTKESCIYDSDYIVDNLSEDFFNFDDEIKDIIKDFETQRNQLIHVGLQTIKSENLFNAVRLIISIFTQFYYEANNFYGAFNYLENILGTSLFNKFSSLPGLKAEIEDMAIKKYDEEYIKYCFGCGFFSMYPKGLNNYKCLFCGCVIEEEFIFHEKCPSCGKEEIIYDSLNISANTYLEGRCSFCKQFFKISRCRHCKKDFFYNANNRTCPNCNKRN